MSPELVLRPEAEADALEAYRWYNEQLHGLGDDFLVEIDRALETIRGNPEGPRKLHRNFRRVLTRRFPYAGFYADQGDRVGYSPFSTRHGILVCGKNGAAMPANQPLQRTGEHRGRPVRAMNRVRGPGWNEQSCRAAELGRYPA